MASPKLKLLYLMKILLEKTDEKHPLTISELIIELTHYDIQAERKSIYTDFELLRVFGLDVLSNKARSTGYYIGSRDFELPELKLLVDSVQSSRFITYKKSTELIKKLERLCSIYEGQSLHRQVFVEKRIKTMNESIYYNVDKIHVGIGEDKKISFKYFEYNLAKDKVFRKNSQRYIISPYALTLSEENYYLLGYDTAASAIKHYRVDKMADIIVLDDDREGPEQYKNLDVVEYSNKLFSMFHGDEETVQIEFDNHLVGVVIDRFGKDVVIMRTDENHFKINEPVTLSPQFFSWVFSFGNEARILSPQYVAEQMRNQLQIVLQQYSTPEYAHK